MVARGGAHSRNYINLYLNNESASASTNLTSLQAPNANRQGIGTLPVSEESQTKTTTASWKHFRFNFSTLNFSWSTIIDYFRWEIAILLCIKFLSPGNRILKFNRIYYQKSTTIGKRPILRLRHDNMFLEEPLILQSLINFFMSHDCVSNIEAW